MEKAFFDSNRVKESCKVRTACSSYSMLSINVSVPFLKFDINSTHLWACQQCYNCSLVDELAAGMIIIMWTART